MDKQPVSRSPVPVRAAGAAAVRVPERTPGAVSALWSPGEREGFPVSPGNVLGLQRIVGNGAVQRILASQARGGVQTPGTVGTAPGSEAQRAPANRTGLPDALKAGVEALSGYSLDDVRVHRNSSAPAQLQAHAYALGADIHLAPGQERHLAHEAWHVVQQKQGRVQATAQLESGVSINGDARLEREADTMGARAASFAPAEVQREGRPSAAADLPVVQRVGNIRFANLSSGQAYQDKGASVIEALRASNRIRRFLLNKDALITLENTPGVASVVVVGDQVQITLSPWFFETQSSGRILGMLAHEFGVHPLADEQMNRQDRTQEGNDRNTRFATGLPNNHEITPAAAGQTDHVFAAVAGQPRFMIYQGTVYEAARGLLTKVRGNNPQGATEADVTDLIMTYLSDVAMILATNDHRMKIVTNSTKTAAAFNLVRDGWILFLHNRPQADDLDRGLQARTPGTKTGDDVLGEVKSLFSGRFSFLFKSGGPVDSTRSQPAVPGEITPVQEGVLQDHGLALVQGPSQGKGQGDLFEAIEWASGMVSARDTAVKGMASELQDPGRDRGEKRLIQKALGYVNDHPTITDASWSTLNIIAVVLGIKLRVLHPDGRFTVFALAVQNGTVAVVRTEKPGPRFRAAR